MGGGGGLGTIRMRLDAQAGRTGAPEDLDVFKSNSGFYAAVASWAVIGQNRRTDSPVASLGGRVRSVASSPRGGACGRRRAALPAQHISPAPWRCHNPPESPGLRDPGSAGYISVRPGGYACTDPGRYYRRYL